MAGNYKLADEVLPKNASLKTYLLISRNKDNKGVLNFKERRRSFIAKDGSTRPGREFRSFIAEAVPGEVCRMYQSVNARDPEKTRQGLLIHLITKAVHLEHIDTVVASIAARKECATERRWLFDFDSNDPKLLNEFLIDVKEYFNKEEKHHIEAHYTPHGYAIIVPHGFDTRQALAGKEHYISLKRDGMLIVAWESKPDNNHQGRKQK